MKYSERIQYTNSTQELLNIFTNPDFFRAKYAATGARDIEILDMQATPERFMIKVSRKVPSDVPIPSFAKSFVPQDITLIQTDSWDLRTATGTLDIQFVGIPVKVSCGLKLVNDGTNAIEDLDFDIRVNVPLIGGKLEKLLADDLKVKFARDTEITLGMIPHYL